MQVDLYDGHKTVVVVLLLFTFYICSSKTLRIGTESHSVTQQPALSKNLKKAVSQHTTKSLKDIRDKIKPFG